MRNNVNYDVLILSLCALFLMMFSLVLFFHFEGPVTSLAFGCLSIYFALVAWRKIAKSNKVLFSLLGIIALALAFEVGFSMAYLVVIIVMFICITLPHHFLSPHNKLSEHSD
ncbi:hypothetical protein [Glaciecola sp. SC05]|uniref:hypothetical protein n=1 Tax=Glaciecola sp. SC05 TaxID=1987355 RepID=UPI00352904EA